MKELPSAWRDPHTGKRVPPAYLRVLETTCKGRWLGMWAYWVRYVYTQARGWRGSVSFGRTVCRPSFPIRRRNGHARWLCGQILPCTAKK